MPTFKQLLGADDWEIANVEWIAREQGIYILAEAHAYLCALRDVHGVEVMDALLLIHGALLELQAQREMVAPEWKAPETGSEG